MIRLAGSDGTMDDVGGLVAPDAPALNIVGDVKSLHVETPFDVIVITIRKDVPVTQDRVATIIASWKEVTQLPNPVVCLIDGMDVKKVQVGGSK